MLKLIQNEVPTGLINSSNKEYVVNNYIGYIQSIIVDGTNISTNYSFLHDTITLDVAPTTSIVVSYFMREERDIMGNGEVTMGDIIDDVYDELGRKEYSKVYSKDRIRKELNKTIGLMSDIVPERGSLQHYSFKGLNGLTVEKDKNTVSITTKESYPLDINGSFLVGKGIYYNYYDYDGIKFDVAGNDLIDDFDKILVGHKIPYGVERVSEIYVNGVKLEYIDSRDFYIDTTGFFTIIKDYQGNEYIYLPFKSKEYTCVIKYIPDYAISSHDEDILNIPYRYTRVFVYDIVYRILASREDDRWQYYKNEYKLAERQYKQYKSKATRKTKSKIGFAPIYNERNNRNIVDILPEGIYDSYL